MKKWGLYQWSVLACFVIVPVIGATVQIVFTYNCVILILLRWFVFGIVGLRLISAGVKQAMIPDFTAKSIFNLSEKDAFALVRELGFANCFIGVMGTCCLFFNSMLLPVAIVAVLYYLCDGIQHIIRKEKNNQELFACITDIYAATVLMVFSIIYIIIK